VAEHDQSPGTSPLFPFSIPSRSRNGVSGVGEQGQKALFPFPFFLFLSATSRGKQKGKDEHHQSTFGAISFFLPPSPAVGQLQ